MTQKESSDLEYILTLDVNETALSKVSLAINFMESKHSVSEYSTFFYWLANELDKGEIEFNNSIFDRFKLNRDRARTLSCWLLRILV